MTEREWDKVPLSELHLSHRPRAILERRGITTVGQLCSFSALELLSNQSWGMTTIEEIMARLAEHGLALRPDPPPVSTSTPVRICTDAPEGDISILEERLERFNAIQTALDDSKPIRFTIYDEEENLIGGLGGLTSLEWLYIGVLWVDEAYRGKGLARRLLVMAEEEAVRRGCRGSCLTTFTFQAPDFYRALGYQSVAELEDYPLGESLFVMRKALIREARDEGQEERGTTNDTK